MHSGLSLTAQLLVVLYVAFASVAVAQTAPVPEQSAKEQASAHFRSGVELFHEEAFRAALVEFERAYEISPEYRLLYNIGQVQLQLGDYLNATQSYERYLAEGGAEVPAARRETVEASLKVLHQRVGRLSITSNADGAEIFVDDQPVGVSPLATTVVLNVGRHRVYARGADGAVSTQVIDIAGGDLREVKLVLKAPTARLGEGAGPAGPMSFKRKLAIASWGTSGALLIGAVTAGIFAKLKLDDRKAELNGVRPDQNELRTLGKSATKLAFLTDALAGLGIGGVVAGTVLWILDAREAEAKPSDGPNLSWAVGLGSINAVGTF